MYTSSVGGRPNYLEGASHMYTSSEGSRPIFLIPGTCLRCIYPFRRWQTKLPDTWQVTQIRILRQKVARGRPNFLIYGRSLRYVYFVRRLQIHGRFLRYVYFVRRLQTKLLDIWTVRQIHILH